MALKHGQSNNQQTQAVQRAIGRRMTALTLRDLIHYREIRKR